MRKHVVSIIYGVIAAIGLSAVATAWDDDDHYKIDAGWLRQYIGRQVGGIDLLKVPATDAGIPVPAPMPGSGNTPYRLRNHRGKTLSGVNSFFTTPFEPTSTQVSLLTCLPGRPSVER